MNENIESACNSDKKSEKKHFCQECGSSFYRPYRLKQHLLIHQNIKSFVCGEENCKKSYTSKSHLDRHIRTVHINPDVKVIHNCPECMQPFSNRQNLKRHLNIKHFKKTLLTCAVCNSTFKKKHQLNAHMYQHTFVKAFSSCELCGKEFATPQERKKHMKYHKTYNCDHCAMAFDRWSQYLKHKKIEHNYDEYICNECGRKFKKRGHIVHHLKIHTPTYKPKFFPCHYEDCESVYSRYGNLKQHIQTKHLQVTHDCHICEAKLSTKASLKTHLRIHLISPVKKPPKTKATGRKLRKDVGVPRSITATKIAGLLFANHTVNEDNLIENTNGSEDSQHSGYNMLSSICEVQMDS